MPIKRRDSPAKSRPSHSRARQIKAERQLLAALCQQKLPPPATERLRQFLAAHKFASTEHQLIFSALSRIPTARMSDPSTVRQLLATRLTLMGFPDFQIDDLFTSVPPPENSIPAILKMCGS